MDDGPQPRHRLTWIVRSECAGRLKVEGYVMSMTITRLHIPGQVSNRARHYFHIFGKGRRHELDSEFNFRAGHNNNRACRRNLPSGFLKRSRSSADGTEEAVVFSVNADNSI